VTVPQRRRRKVAPRRTHITERKGVSEFEHIVGDAGWVFHAHDTIDFGIDGHVETADDDGYPSGAQVAVQIKGGPSEFDEPSPNGWWFRFEDRHYRYWTGYCMPVYVVLVDTDARTFYWQRVTASTVFSTGKNWKVEVPRSNTVAAAIDVWHREAGGFLDEASERAALVQGMLPPAAVRALDPLREHTPDVVSHLTAYLGGSATAPGLAVQSLLAAPPRWMNEAPGEALLVVAAFAASHGLHEQAAAAFSEAAEELPTRRARLLTAAASNLIDVDRAAARALLPSPGDVDNEDRLTYELVRASIEHPVGDATPNAEPAVLDEEPARTRDDQLAQTFLGMNAIRRGEWDRAVEHLGRALELDRDDSVTMLRLAEARTRRSGTAASRLDDLTTAGRLSDDAHRQRHRWHGPSTRALVQLLKILIVDGEFREALRRARPESTGTAFPEEAVDAEVLALAVTAALASGDLDLARDLTEQLPASARRSQLELDLSPDLEDAAIAGRLSGILDAALAQEDFETVVRIVLRLAQHDVDRTSDVERLRQLGSVPETHVALPRAILLARSDLDVALHELRRLAGDHAVAAQTLVALLVRAGRHDEALNELDGLPASLRVSAHDLRVGVLLDAGREDAAEQAAVDALTDPSLGDAERLGMYRLLASRAGRRDDPLAVTRWCRRALGGVPAVDADRSIAWWLITAELDVGRVDEAWQVFSHYDPPAVTREEVQTWTALHRLRGWTTDARRQGLALARKWADDVLVSARLLAAMILPSGPEPPVDEAEPEDLHKALWEELSAHCDRFGEATPIQQVTFDPDNVDEMFRGSLQERTDVIEKVTRAVQLLQLPLGMLAEAVGRPYALGVIQRAAGMVPACTPVEAEYDAELAAASDVLAAPRPRRVVTDATALHLAKVLDVARQLAQADLRRVLPRASRRDVQSALLEARQLVASPGSVSWDSVADQPVLHEATAEEQNEILRRAERLDAAARACEVVVEGPLQVLGDRDSEGSEAWLAPLQVAVDEAVPLWSDDVVLRRLARETGVPTFGTLALLDAIAQQADAGAHLGDGDEFERVLDALLDEWVVDAPWTVQQLVDRAQRPDAPLGPLLAVLARPWRYADPDERADAVAAVQRAASAGDEQHRQWFSALAYGHALASTEPAAIALSFAATVALAGPAQAERLAMYVTWLRQLFQAQRLPGDPADHLDIVKAAVDNAGGDGARIIKQVRAALAAS